MSAISASRSCCGIFFLSKTRPRPREGERRLCDHNIAPTGAMIRHSLSSVPRGHVFFYRSQFYPARGISYPLPPGRDSRGALTFFAIRDRSVSREVTLARIRNSIGIRPHLERIGRAILPYWGRKTREISDVP
jgi:hypothetical protein